MKYTTSGSITLETERLGDMAVIRIIDTGVGIHPRLAEHINTLAPGKYLLGDHRWPDEYRGLGLLMVTEFQLSRRELQVLLKLARGRRTNEVATELSLSPKTVATHRARLMRKLGARTCSDLTYYAVKHRLVE